MTRGSTAVSPDVDAYIVVTFRVYEEGNKHVSECIELGTASCGDTIDQAINNIAEATLLYLNAIEESGERDRIFRRRKIRIILGHPHEETTLIPARYGDVVSPFVHEFPVTRPEGASHRAAPAAV